MRRFKHGGEIADSFATIAAFLDARDVEALGTAHQRLGWADDRGAQAGLSWMTILKKRENYRRAFDKFDARKIAAYDERKLEALLADAGIIRNRQKVTSAISNAAAFLAVQEEFGSFDAYIWGFVGGAPIKNASAVVHGNTDDAWLGVARWLLRNRVLPPKEDAR